MPNILLLDTTTDICSVAITKDNQIIASRETENFRDHGKVITLFIQDCLRDASLIVKDIDAIAVSAGPGSFTSLRIGYSTAKGLCMGLGVPLITIDTLTALALAAINQTDHKNTFYTPMLDARSMGVYFSVFDKNGVIVKALDRQKITLDTLEEFYTNGNQLVVCGNAAKKYEELISQTTVTAREPFKNSASFLSPLALKAWQEKSFADLAYAVPNYVAPPNITTPKKRPPVL